MIQLPEGIVFGHMHEDHRAELALLDRLPVRRALVIASGGDLALLLAGAGLEVRAVDVNPAQTALVQFKMDHPAMAAGLCFSGKVDRVCRRAGPGIAWLFDYPRLKPGVARRFLIKAGSVLVPLAVGLLHGRKARDKINAPTVQLMQQRLDGAMSSAGASENPLLQVLLGKGFGPSPPPVWTAPGMETWQRQTNRISLQTTGLGEFLDANATRPKPEGYGLISVSNLPDAMPEEDWNQLLAKVHRALLPGGIVVVRSMLQASLEIPPTFGFEALPWNRAEDQSPLCPIIWIGKKLPPA